MNGPVVCLAVKRGSLDDFLRVVLYEAALQLMRKGRPALGFRNDRCVGLIQTEFKTVVLSTMTGIKFIAELDAEGQTGKVEVHFLIEGRDISDDLLHDIAAAKEEGILALSPTGTTYSAADTKLIVGAAPTRMSAAA